MPGQRASARGKKAASAARHSPLTGKLLLRNAVVVAAGGLVIYLLLPKLTRVLASWSRLTGLAPAWMVLALAAEVASFTCYFGLQRLALRTSAWFAGAGRCPAAQHTDAGH